MKCPNPDCNFEHPADYNSPFCDECNQDIFKCVNSDCEAFNVFTINAKNCNKCGEPVEPNGSAQQAEPVKPTQVPQQVTSLSSSTEFMPSNGVGSRLFFCHTDGWKMELSNGDILGRINGNHVDKLGSIKVISGTHAKITLEQDGWYIADQKSTNKTWVNGKEAVPFEAVKIKQNDTVILANAKFTVNVI